MITSIGLHGRCVECSGELSFVSNSFLFSRSPSFFFHIFSHWFFILFAFNNPDIFSIYLKFSYLLSVFIRRHWCLHVYCTGTRIFVFFLFFVKYVCLFYRIFCSSFRFSIEVLCWEFSFNWVFFSFIYSNKCFSISLCFGRYSFLRFDSIRITKTKRPSFDSGLPFQPIVMLFYLSPFHNNLSAHFVCRSFVLYPLNLILTACAINTLQCSTFAIIWFWMIITNKKSNINISRQRQNTTDTE